MDREQMPNSFADPNRSNQITLEITKEKGEDPGHTFSSEALK
jgi:hypothetical protein